MYVYNKPPVDSMVMEYYVSGVPDCIMLGNQKQADPSAYTQSDIDGEFSGGSPVKVQVNDVISSGTTHSVTIIVSTVGPVPAGTYRLRTVISESLHFATAPGSNGEKEFPNVFRKMMPSWAGDAIVLAPVGGSVQFNYNYTEDPVWNMADVRVTSYVQDINSRAVLNCGAVGDPAINYTLSAPAVSVQHGTASGISAFLFTSANTGSATEQFSYTLTGNAPSDWSADFSIGGLTYAGSASVGTPSNGSNAITIHITPGTTPFVGRYTLKVQSVTNPGYPPMVSSVYVIANVTDLIVNNSGYIGDNTTVGSAANWDSVYTAGLAFANRLTVASTDEKVMTKAIAQNAFAGVKNIYLNIGWTFPSFSDAEVAQLSAFLNGGGCLLVSGQDVGWDTWDTSTGNGTGTVNTRAFYTNFLSAAFLNDGVASNNQLDAVPTDSVWKMMPNAPILNFYGGTNFFPDEIAPAGIGVPICTYDGTTKVAGVRASNGIWKTIYIAPGIEMMDTRLNRSTIIKRAHDWFYSAPLITGIRDANSAQPFVGQNYPNPSNGSTTLPLANIERDLVMQLVDLQGRVLQVIRVPAGSEQIKINTTGLAEGMYLCRLSDGVRQLISRPLHVMR
jgi:hypothetical protein